jgi:hypothetical protein
MHACAAIVLGCPEHDSALPPVDASSPSAALDILTSHLTSRPSVNVDSVALTAALSGVSHYEWKDLDTRTQSPPAPWTSLPRMLDTVFPDRRQL